MERTVSLTKKRIWFHSFGLLGLLVIAHFWLNYFEYNRANSPAPFNAFLAQYSFAGAHALKALMAAILFAGLATFASKLWWLVALGALVTILFLSSQVT